MSAVPALAAEMPVPELVDLTLTVTPGLARSYAVAQVCAWGASRLLPVSLIVAGGGDGPPAPAPPGRAVPAQAAMSKAVPAAAAARSAAVSCRDLCPASATDGSSFPRRAGRRPRDRGAR